jgi:hypothetical protein
MDRNMVTLIVGPEKHSFQMDKQLLCDKVNYFHSMFNGGFKEASTIQGEFPEETVDTFRMFLSWVNTGELPALQATDIETNRAADPSYA